MMKPSRGKPSLYIITILICAVAFIVLLYTERIGTTSSNAFFNLRTCSKKVHVTKSHKSKTDQKSLEVIQNLEEDDRIDFDPDMCSVVHGKWVFNGSYKPLYSERTCPYLDLQVSCVKNGRPDSDYLQWEWQPDDCTLLSFINNILTQSHKNKFVLSFRFNPEIALKKLRGKRLMFVGDSLQRGQWQSFVCMIQSIIPEKKKSMKRGKVLSVFKAKEYNATIEFYWAPFLIESNSDLHIIGDPKKRILRVDSITKHAKNWVGVDILVFNTFVWWLSGPRIKSLWGSFANGEDGYEELEAQTAYRLGLKTWANWVDSTVNPNKTQVFFTTMSPTHMRSADWKHNNGIGCYNETRPYLKRGYHGTGSDARIMKVVSEVVNRMKVPVTVLNITQLSEHRIDAHTSVYTETQGKVLTDEEKADPKRYADCIHWCLPGVPDTWNQLFYAYL